MNICIWCRSTSAHTCTSPRNPKNRAAAKQRALAEAAEKIVVTVASDAALSEEWSPVLCEEVRALVRQAAAEGIAAGKAMR